MSDVLADAMGAPDTTQRFASLAALQANNDALLTELDSPTLAAEFWGRVEVFARRARSTGAVLDETRDRRSAQSMLDFWSNALYRVGIALPSARLAEFDPALAPALPDEPCPYQGLSAFQERDSEFFYGREALVDQLAGRLGAGDRLLALVGASGSGKSSVVFGGLLPRLKGGALPGSADWRYAAMVPGSDPLANLTRTLALPGDEHPQPGESTAAAGLTAVSRPLALVVDQLEELFTLCADDAQRRAFAGDLLALLDAPGSQDVVILTMRVDFVDAVEKLPELAARFREARIDVGALDINELRAAIEKPAAKVGLKFEAGIVDDLITTVLGERAGLPLLQFTLFKLWQRRQRNRVPRDVYAAVGNPREALERSAEALYSRLIPEEQRTLKYILLEMVRPGEGREVTSSRIARSRVFRGGEAADRVERVVQRLTDEGLVKATLGAAPGDAQIEVAHEALVRNWPRLVDWLDDERERLRSRRRLTDDARRWQSAARDPNLLLRGRALEAAEQYTDLDALEAEFIAAGLALVEAEARAKEEQQRKEYELEATRKVAEERARTAVRLRRRAWALAAALVLSLVLAAAAIAAVVWASQAQELAERQRDVARSSALTANAKSNRDRQQELGLLLHVEAKKVTPTYETRSAFLAGLQHNPRLTRFLHGQQPEAMSLALSPDGKALASTGSGNTIVLWDMTDPSAAVRAGEPLTGHQEPVYSVAFSPDGKVMASGSRDGAIIVWDARDPQALARMGAPLAGHQGAVWSIAFSPDHKLMASGGEDGQIIVWDVSNPRAPARLANMPTEYGPAYSMAFSPDGGRMASAHEDGSVVLWSMNDPRSSAPSGELLTGHEGAVYSAAFSPDGKVLASGGDDRTVILWDVANSESTSPLGQPLTGHEGAVYSVAFDPDGQILVSGSADKTLRLWNVQEPDSITPLGQPLTGHQENIRSLAISTDGKTLASAGEDGTIILWNARNLTGDAAPAIQVGLPLTAHQDTVNAVAFSSDGSTLASGSWDRTVILWDVRAPQAPLMWGQPLTGHLDQVWSVAFHPDGKVLASGGQDGTILLWDVSAPNAPVKMSEPLSGHQGIVYSVAFQPEGNVLASSGQDGKVVFWDVRDPKSPVRIGEPLSVSLTDVYGLSFSPDGKVLASGSQDGKVSLWDVTDPNAPALLGQPLQVHNDRVRSLSFSPDGKMLVAGTRGGQLILWDATDPKAPVQVGEPFEGHTRDVASVAFNWHGTLLASGSADSTVILWDVTYDPMSVARLGEPLVGHQGRVRSVAFSPDGKTLASGSEDSTVVLWAVDVDDWQQLACRIANRNLTDAEWQVYMRDVPYHETCPLPDR